MSKSDRSNLPLGIKKGENYQKHTKNTNFWSKSLVFCKEYAGIMNNNSRLLFCKEKHEQMAHGHSFEKIELSELLTVAL